MLLLRQQQRAAAQHAHGVRWSRYTVLLRWPRQAPATNQELATFASHYGPVRASAGAMACWQCRSCNGMSWCSREAV